MALVLKWTMEGYRYAMVDLADKRLEHLPLIKSPIPVIAIVVAYLMFVFKFGPEFMKNREPFNLKKIIIAYNAFQMIVSFGVVLGVTYCLDLRLWYCNPVNPTHLDHPLAMVCAYTYYLMKFGELLDTVFFVLKKNYRQVTVLHTFHHTLMVMFGWILIKYVPSGHSGYIPLINSIVHVVMYGYYLLTAYDPKFKQSIRWKKHITQLQLFQFGLFVIIYLAPILNGCPYPRGILYGILLNNTIMIILFSNFYYHSYIKNKSKST